MASRLSGELAEKGAGFPSARHLWSEPAEGAWLPGLELAD